MDKCPGMRMSMADIGHSFKEEQKMETSDRLDYKCAHKADYIRPGKPHAEVWTFPNWEPSPSKRGW